MIKQILYGLSFLLIISCGNTEVEYHLNGEKRVVSELKHGKKHGTSTTYFEDGKVESKTEWKDGLRNGVCNYYYENGALELTAIYSKGLMIDSALFYYKSGDLREVQRFYEDGRVESYKKFDKEGFIKQVGSMPDFQYKTNVVQLKDTFFLKIDYSNSLFDSANVIIGNLNPNNQEVLDTLQILRSDNNIFLYSILADSSGTFHVTGNARDLKYVSSDLIESNVIPFRITYYVEESEDL